VNQLKASKVILIELVRRGKERDQAHKSKNHKERDQVC